MEERMLSPIGISLKVKITSLLVLSAVILGLILLHFDMLGYNQHLEQQEAALSRLVVKLDNYIYKLKENSVRVAENKWIRKRLTEAASDPGELEDIPELQAALYSIQQNSGASIVYIMNPEGLVIDSSIYEGGVRLRGNRYRFRPYFQEAMSGHHFIYSALGVTTLKHGLYFSSPVYGLNKEKPIGVVVMKIGMERIDQVLIDSDMTACILSPDGIVFAANRPEWMYRAALPLTGHRREQLKASKQFADKPLDSLPMFLDREVITENGNRFSILSRDIANPGWKVMVAKKIEGTFPVAEGVLACVIVVLITLLLLANLLNNRKKFLLESARKRAEEELLKSRQLESIGILAAGIAHDFNNHLSIILGNLFFIKEKLDTESGIYKYLINAEKEVQRANELVGKLLTFTKGGWLERDAVDLPDLVSRAVDSVELPPRVEFSSEFADDLYTAYVDARQLKQVFHNLVQNAVEAMEESGGTLTIEAANVVNPEEEMRGSDDVSPLAYDRYVRVSVIDSGKGIPEEYLPKIFDPYFSTKDTWTQKGMGLGLTVCYSIIDKHEGYISVESEEGRGTVVNIYLPVPTEKE